MEGNNTSVLSDPEKGEVPFAKIQCYLNRKIAQRENNEKLQEMQKGKKPTAREETPYQFYQLFMFTNRIDEKEDLVIHAYSNQVKYCWDEMKKEFDFKNYNIGEGNYNRVKNNNLNNIRTVRSEQK